MGRLKSCVYCGRVHDVSYECPRKPKRVKKNTAMNKFRNTSAWQQKREEIKERDKYICQVCFRKLYNTKKQYNYINIQVHHIVPIEEEYGLRLDDENLISLCSYHHDLAERNKIPRELLKDMVEEQMEKKL